MLIEVAAKLLAKWKQSNFVPSGFGERLGGQGVRATGSTGSQSDLGWPYGAITFR